MKDVFVMLEGDIVQWAHAQAVAQGTSVSRLLSAMLRERMLQGRAHFFAGMFGAESGHGSPGEVLLPTGPAPSVVGLEKD